MSDVEKQVQDCYSTWGESYYDEYYGDGAPYPPVHAKLLRDMVAESGARNLLDAGCGPASFLRDVDDRDLALYGFDLTTEMVDEARRVMGGRATIWQGSVADPAAFRSPDAPTEGYDAAVCIGVLPHVPAELDSVVLNNLHDAVRPGGTAIVEARNQLFALFTLNRPTYELFRDVLMPDRDEAELAPLQERFRMDLPPVRGGKADEPGYDEVLSRTHNPFELRAQMEAAGFRDVRVRFYHFHDVPPQLGPSIERSVALEDPDDWRGHFMASAVLVSGIRA